MDFSTRLRGINPTNTVFYSPQPRAEVYCLLMNFKISKLAYLTHINHTCPLYVKNEISGNFVTRCPLEPKNFTILVRFCLGLALGGRFLMATQCASNLIIWVYRVCSHDVTAAGHVGGVNKETASMLEEWNILLGIELYFYANSFFYFIMQI